MTLILNLMALSYTLIKGATQLDMTTWYWTSTEGSSQRAWNLAFSDGYLSYWSHKVQNKGHVRPVSALNKEDR